MPADKRPERADDFVHLTCANCGQQYKIGRRKIPPRAAAVKCKACGQKIRLPQSPGKAATNDDLGPAPQPAAPSGATSDLMRAEDRPAIHRSRKNKWFYALAAVVVLAVILGALATRRIVNLDWLNQLFPRKFDHAAESAQLLESEPFLAINLNIPLILDALEKRLAPDEKTPRLQMMTTMMTSMDLKQVELYLYTATQNQVLPVILAHSSNRQQLENVLSSREPFKKYFTRQSADSYRLKKEALDEAQKNGLSLQSYEVTLIDSGVALAPESFSSSIRKNPQLFANSPIAGFAHSITTPYDLVSFAIRIPAGINQGWEKKIRSHPVLQSIPQTDMIANMGAAIMSQLTGSLESVEALGAALRFTGSHKRALTYAQQFRPEVDGEKIYHQLTAENLADTEINGIIRNLVELLQDRRYRHALNFNDNRLDLEFSWSEEDDEAFLTALTTATIGPRVAGSMGLRPSPGAIEARFMTEPNLVTSVDVEKLKDAIPQIIKNSLYPGNYLDAGDKPTMTLELDTVDIPNAALSELTYEVRTILSVDGRDLLRVEENKFKPRIQPGSLFPGNITLNIEKVTPPETLGKATIDFHLSLPSALEVCEFRMGDKKGSIKEVNGLRVTLDRLENDVAQVSSKGNAIRLMAYDQSGGALASKESMSTSSSTTTRFQGTINTLKVVVISDMLEYPFEVQADLNEGKALALSREPEIPVRIRYDHHPIPAYIHFTAEDTQELNVTWTEAEEDAWNDSLSIKLPKGPFSGHAIWEVHFFDNNKPQLLAGSSVQGFREISYILDKGKLKQIGAAFGRVKLNLHSDISRLIFFKTEKTQPAVQKLPSGDEISVTFNQNEITYSSGDANVIQTAAYDARGKRLKQDQYTRNRGKQRIIYFWGIPAKLVMDVSGTTIKKLVPFDIERRPVDEKAYLAYKQSIENQRDVVKTIKSIDRARRKDRSYYGDDLAGLHYLYEQKKKTPMMLISQEVAHSDPAGQKRFGYKARPYRGYYFTVLSGVESNGVKKNYNRRLKKSVFAWQKGTITTTSLTRHPDLVAIPEDGSQPTFFLQWGQVFMKHLNGEKLEFLPDGYYNKGWVEAKFIQSE
ncbi:MAG: zinc-ribbon domain-containing protein [Desulfobacterales bacterium]|nr:MAG: zinc-ribbon domain-containing protein [Desulfobacterales bacterium]